MNSEYPKDRGIDPVETSPSSAGLLTTGPEADADEPEKADVSQESIDRVAAQDKLDKPSKNGAIGPCFHYEP